MSDALSNEADRKARPSEATPRDGHRGSDATPPPLPGAKGGERPTGLPPPPLPRDGKDTARITLGRCFRSVGPWGISFLFHGLLLIALVFCVASQLTSGLNGSVSLIANPDDDFHDELLDSPFFQDEFALRYGPITQLLADESGRLLERCVRDNPNTPWAYLAQRELDYPLGIAVQQRVIPPPPPRTPRTAQPASPVRPSTRGATVIPPRL